MLRKILTRTFSVSLIAATFPALAAEHTVWYLPNADDTVRQGFIRVVNNSAQAGNVTISGIDEAGSQGGTLTFSLAANETKSFNSGDLQNGNANKGLTSNLGAGTGAWRLSVESELDFDVLAYMRTSDGFLTSVHDAVAQQNGVYQVPVFNPGSNTNQVSILRISNLDNTANTIELSGTDDAGNTMGPINFDIGASQTLALSAQDIENGNIEKGLNSGIGDGSGKWKLQVSASGPVGMVNLLTDPNGYLTNLSSGAPANQPFLLVSDNFENGDTIPQTHACTEKSGGNQSPQLSWSGAPADTASFALIMDDEISPCGTGTQACVHWNVVNIPLGTKNLEEGDISGSGATENTLGYYGPCPPSNHVYNFTIYALTEGMPTLSSAQIGQEGLSRSQFESTYAQYIIKKATLSGEYK